MTDKIEKRKQPLQCRTMARTTTIMSMARASAAMTAAWRLRMHELCRELQRITSKKATHTRRCSSTTIQTIWVAVVTSPTLTVRWCSISSMFLSVRFSLRSATTFGIAPNYSGYRYCFDNPTKFVDLLGLFETISQAKEYRAMNGIKGRIQKNEDGTYSINPIHSARFKKK